MSNEIVLVTALKQERSLRSEAVKDEEGKILFPPKNSDGEPLPYFHDGKLIIPFDVSEEFKWWKDQVNPKAFCLVDVMRYVGCPKEYFDNNGFDLNELSCKDCPYVRSSNDSPNGAQVKCSLDRRSSRFPAGLPLCHSQICSFKEQGFQPEKKTWTTPLMEYSAHVAQQTQNEPLPNNKEPPKPKIRSRILPTIRNQNNDILDVPYLIDPGAFEESKSQKQKNTPKRS